MLPTPETIFDRTPVLLDGLFICYAYVFVEGGILLGADRFGGFIGFTPFPRDPEAIRLLTTGGFYLGAPFLLFI